MDSSQRNQTATSPFPGSPQVRRSPRNTEAPPMVNNSSIFQPVMVNLEEISKSKSGLSKLGAAQTKTKKEISKYVPHRLSESDAKPLLDHFEKADIKRKHGKSYVADTPDGTRDRPLSVFGVAEDVQHDRDTTPATRKKSKNEDSSHGFPQSQIANAFEADMVKRMFSENYIGNQGTTKAIEDHMASMPSDDKRSGHIAKIKMGTYQPGDSSQSVTTMQDAVLKRSNSGNHIDVLFALQHNNADVDRK
ncbi:hypothetical protein [Andreprevotia chitinilytica]|uniref:hypothetical protein n=1 Tax=Andreprevotia chitinilytica TaxID=396808 RepID=UPI0005507192|nr:hypothetical protein [Andreprevotia chitinilytica]